MPCWRFLFLLLALAKPVAGLEPVGEVAQTLRARSPMDTPRGAWAHGAIDDYVLRSGSVHAVIGGFPGESDADTVAPFRFGALLDVVPSLRHPDGLGYVIPTLADSVGQVDLGEPAVQFSSGLDGAASISVTRIASETRASFATDYQVLVDSPGVAIESRLTGTTSPDWMVEDRIAWGEYELFVPGVGVGMPDGAMVQGVEFLLGQNETGALLLFPERGTLSALRDGAVTAVRYDEATLGEPVRRWLLVGEDTATLFTRFMETRREDASGRLSGMVRERATDAGSGAAWSRAAGGAEMMLAIPGAGDSPEGGAARPYLPFKTRADGSFDVVVPAGEYLVGPGRSRTNAEPALMRVSLSSGSVARELDFHVAAFPSMRITVLDGESGEEIPARLVFSRMDGKPFPSLGKQGEARSGDTIFSSNGREIVSLPTGDYEVRASLGIDCHPVTECFTIREGEVLGLEVSLSRAFDTEGWLAGDLASRTREHRHSSATLSARISSARAEKLDWIAPGNATAVLAVARPRVLTSWLKESSSPGKLSVLRIGRVVSADNAPGIWMPTESEWLAMTALRDAELAALLQSENVVGLAVWDASVPDAFGTRFQRLHALRAAGLSLLSMGVGNSFGTVGEEPGYPRIYVEADEPGDVADSLFAGRYQVTNGPFVELRINGEEVTGDVETSDGVLDFDLRIHAIDDVSVARLTVLVNGRLTRQILFNESLRESGSGVAVPMPGDPDAGRFRLVVSSDSVIDLVIEGDEDRPNALVSPRGMPFARSNAERGTLSRAFLAPITVRLVASEELEP